jgi:hypothetical protein
VFDDDGFFDTVGAPSIAATGIGLRMTSGGHGATSTHRTWPPASLSREPQPGDRRKSPEVQQYMRLQRARHQLTLLDQFDQVAVGSRTIAR